MHVNCVLVRFELMKQEVTLGAAPGLCRPPQEVLLEGPCDLLPSCYLHAHILGGRPPPSRLLILSQLLNLLIFCPLFGSLHHV